jgi:uncharacterized protein
VRGVRRACIALAIFVALASAAHAVAHRLLFPAPPVPVHAPALEPGAERVELAISGGRVEAFLLPPDPPSDSAHPLVVYAHGNGELVDGWLARFGELRAAGAAVLLVEYPGYGRSSGTASESSIRDALAAGYDWASARPAIDAQRVVGWGRSLGGGVVVALARVRPLAALVLESTFTSIRDVAADDLGVPRFLVGDAFDNLAFVRGYAAPVLVLHGDEDRLVPVAHARRLAAAAPHAELAVDHYGHGCPQPFPAVIAFFRANGLLDDAALPDQASILSTEAAPAALHQCSRPTPDGVEGFWQPSADDVARLERALRAFLATSADARDVGALDGYTRQYAGVVVRGERRIYGNFFAKSHLAALPAGAADRWRKEAVVVCDGGPSFWGILFDPRTAAFDAPAYNGPL